MARLIVFLSVYLLSAMCLSKESQGHIEISVEVTCDCPVNGIIVPIHDKACVPECHRLQKANNYGSSNTVTKNGITTITY